MGFTWIHPLDGFLEASRPPGLTYLARCCQKLQHLTLLGGSSSAASSLLLQVNWAPEKQETGDRIFRSPAMFTNPGVWLHPDWINSPTSPSTPGSTAAGGSVHRRHERWLVARLSMHQARCRGGDPAMVPPAMGEIYHGQKNTSRTSQDVFECVFLELYSWHVVGTQGQPH